MNQETNPTPIEEVLRDITPAAVSPALAHQVDEELKLDMSWLNFGAPVRQRTRWLAPAGWAGLGAAAAVAIMSLLSLKPATEESTATVATTPAVLPVSTIREWEDVKDDGIHYSKELLPEQHVRLIARDRQTWIDPRDGAQITVETPRVEKVVLPVSFQ